MKKLRIILLYKIIIVSFFLSILFCFYRIYSYKVDEYNNDLSLVGVVTDIKKSDDSVSIVLKSNINVLVYVKDFNFSYGDVVRVTGLLELPSLNTLFNLFNYRNYLRSRGINYVMYPKSIEVLSGTDDFRFKFKNFLVKYVDSFKSSAYLRTFIFGDTNDVYDDVISSFQVNGISHLFCVSGMHLSLFAGIISFILKRFKVCDGFIFVFLVLFFLFFSFLTGYSPSILRALIMYFLFGVCRCFGFKIKGIYVWMVTFQILILYNPFYIYGVGFLFSFVVSLFLFVFSYVFQNSKNYFFKVFLISLISLLASLPIQINNFFQVNLLSPIVNIIFVPFVSFIVFPFSILTLFVKPLDGIFFSVVKLLEFLSLKIQFFSFSIVLARVPWYIVILYYIFIILFINGIHRKNFKMFLPLVLLMFFHVNVGFFFRNNFVSFLDVGQGDSIFLKVNSKSVLIDTGGNTFFKNNIVVRKTIPFLKSVGVNHLDYLILTHGDFDHIGEAINLVNNFKVEKVIFNCGEYNDLEKELIKVLDKKRIKYYSCVKELNIDKNKLQFLQTKEYDNENDNSNVIITELNGYKFMFMGDASSVTEKEIMSIYNLPDIDILKVGHHGSKTSSSIEFIDEINPAYSIISVGKNNRYGHPNKETLDNLVNSKIYRTDLDGSIMFKIKNNKLQVETCSP